MSESHNNTTYILSSYLDFLVSNMTEILRVFSVLTNDSDASDIFEIILNIFIRKENGHLNLYVILMNLKVYTIFMLNMF
jgi:hypothetical protein